MHASRPTRQLRPILVAAALGLLAALFMPQTPHARADSVQPFVQGWHVNGSSLVLIYGELLDETSVPATSKFTVNIDGTVKSGSGEIRMFVSNTRGKQTTFVFVTATRL